jgi:hypothetical protein
MLVRPAREAWGGAAAKAHEYSAECLGCDAKGGHVSVRDLGRVLVGVESCKLLQNLGCNGGEGESLQAACGAADVAGLQEGVHAGCQGAIRGLRGATVAVATSPGARRKGILCLCLVFFRLSGLKSFQDAAVLAFAGGDSEAAGGKAEEGADCRDLGVGVRCLLDPGELQFDSPLPFVAQGLGGAGPHQFAAGALPGTREALQPQVLPRLPPA